MENARTTIHFYTMSNSWKQKANKSLRAAAVGLVCALVAAWVAFQKEKTHWLGAEPEVGSENTWWTTFSSASSNLTSAEEVGRFFDSIVRLPARERCAIDIVDGAKLSGEDFRRLYAGRKPVLLEAVHDEVFAARVSREALLSSESSAGDLELRLGSAVSYTRVKRDRGMVRLRDFVQTSLKPQRVEEEEAAYLFGNHHGESWDDFLDTYDIPRFASQADVALSFGIGARLTGVPFHFHGAGFQEVFHVGWEGGGGGEERGGRKSGRSERADQTHRLYNDRAPSCGCFKRSQRRA